MNHRTLKGKPMRKISTLLLLSYIGISTHSYAEVDTPALKVSSLLEANMTLPHVPESCSLIDQASRCIEEIEHVHFIKDIIKIFSTKKGDSVIYTTEHFEQLIAKMRELNFTKTEIASFREHPDLCIEKLRPVLELAAVQADIHLDEELVKQFCSQAATAYSTWDGIDGLLKTFGGTSNRALGVVATLILFGGSTYKLGLNAAGVLVTGIVLANFMYFKAV